jgi:hypothetical protein
MNSFKSFVALTALFASAMAAPAPSTSTNVVAPGVMFNPSPGNSVNDCGGSSFDNQSSGGSPRVDDCRQIAANIAGGGTWTINVGDTRQLVQYGTCAFNAGSSQDLFHVGNQDIIDLINDSISRFEWNGLVGSKGHMTCQDAFGNENVGVNWGLYHT